MASTFTPNLNLEKPARGDQVGSWDTAVNGNFDLIDTAVAAKIALTDLSVSVAAAGTANLSYNNTTGTFTYTPPDLSGYLSSGDNISSLTNDAGYTTNTGTVTSVALTVPTGLTVSGSPITASGTFTIAFDAGYSIPTTTKQGQWDSAYNNQITGVSLVGGTLTLTQLDAGTLTVDLDSRYLTSVAFSDLTSTPTTLAGYGVTSVDLGSWTVTEDGSGNLLFSDGGVAKMRLTPAGDLEVAGDVKASVTL